MYIPPADYRSTLHEAAISVAMRALFCYSCYASLSSFVFPFGGVIWARLDARAGGRGGGDEGVKRSGVRGESEMRTVSFAHSLTRLRLF